MEVRPRTGCQEHLTLVIRKKDAKNPHLNHKESITRV